MGYEAVAMTSKESEEYEKSERVWRGEKEGKWRESNREGATCEVLGGDTNYTIQQYTVYSI